MPFGPAIFRAGRWAFPQDPSARAPADGATAPRRFVHITFPLLANLYLVCTLLSTIWTIGDFNTVYFVSGGAPGWTTDVLTTLAFRYAFDFGNPPLAVPPMGSILPGLIPAGIVLIARLHTRAL